MRKILQEIKKDGKRCRLSPNCKKSQEYFHTQEGSPSLPKHNIFWEIPMRNYLGNGIYFVMGTQNMQRANMGILG